MNFITRGMNIFRCNLGSKVFRCFSASAGNNLEEGGAQASARQGFYAMLVLVVAVLLLFWPVYRHDFINCDDNLNVYENDLVTNFSADNLRLIWQKPYLNLYVPLTYTFWQLQAKLSDLLLVEEGSTPNPMVFHSSNLIFHLLNVLLVFVIVRRLLNNTWAALAGALLFGVHPVQVEPVAWVTGFRGVFSGFWSLLAIRQYLVYLRCSEDNTKLRLVHYGLTFLLMVCAVLSKPSAVVVPVFIALIAFFWAKRSLRRIALETMPMVIAVLPLMILTTVKQSDIKELSLPLWQRLLICGDTFSFYIGKLLWPMENGLYYGRTPEFVLSHAWHYATGLIPYVLLAWLLWKGGRQFLLAAGIFIAAILPVSGLVTFSFQVISTVADRYLYLPMLGVALAVGLLAKARTEKFSRWALFGLIALYGLRSMPLVHNWQDSITLNQHNLQVNPKSRRAYSNLGSALAYSGRFEEAIIAHRQYLTLKPEDPLGYYNLGNALLRAEDLTGAVAAFTQAITLDPGLYAAYGNLGLLFLQQGDLDQAEHYLQMLVQLEPQNGLGYMLLGDLKVTQGDVNEAWALYQQASYLQPDSKEIAGRLSNFQQ